MSKLRQQGDASVRSRLPVRIVAVVGGAADFGHHVHVVRADQLAGSAWPVLARLARYRLIERALPADTARIVLRLPGACDPSLPSFLLRHGRVTISEHHGDEIAERRRMARGLVHHARLLGEAVALRALLHGVGGALGVTPEIARLAATRARSGLPVGWVGNGFDCFGQIASGFLPYRGGQLHVVAVIGNAAPWHGIDRLFAGLALNRDPHRVILHLVGDRPAELAGGNTPPRDVVLHGRLHGQGLDTLLAQMHLGIASLALHRAGLSQACPLKSREYAARGLPFVYAYDDPDLPDGLPGCLRLASSDEPIVPEMLCAFAAGLLPDAGTRLRAFALANLDWAQKIACIHRFATEAVG